MNVLQDNERKRLKYPTSLGILKIMPVFLSTAMVVLNLG
jgi:hypothetical protein